MSLQQTASNTLPDAPLRVLDRTPVLKAATVATVARHERIVFFDVAKGIGILLVVVGHCLDGLHDAGMVAETSIAWLCFYAIYCFHMPLFFFLSASLVHSRIALRPGRFLRSSLTRIAYPYFVWATIQSLVMLAASGLINHPIREGIGPFLVQILWKPPGQFWFLYILFLLHMVALVTIRHGGCMMLAFVLAAVFAATAVSPAAAGFVTSYISGSSLLGYAIGICFGDMMAGWRGRFEKPQAWILLSFVLFAAAVWSGWRIQANAYSFVTLPAACSGCIGTLLLARTELLCRSRWLIHLGQRSMPIYVLHVLFVAGARIILAKGLHVTEIGVLLPLIFAAGVVGPLLVDRVTRVLRVQSALGLA